MGDGQQREENGTAIKGGQLSKHNSAVSKKIILLKLKAVCVSAEIKHDEATSINGTISEIYTIHYKSLH